MKPNSDRSFEFLTPLFCWQTRWKGARTAIGNRWKDITSKTKCLVRENNHIMTASTKWNRSKSHTMRKSPIATFHPTSQANLLFNTSKRLGPSIAVSTVSKPITLIMTESITKRERFTTQKHFPREWATSHYRHRTCRNVSVYCWTLSTNPVWLQLTHRCTNHPKATTKNRLTTDANRPTMRNPVTRTSKLGLTSIDAIDATLWPISVWPEPDQF